DLTLIDGSLPQNQGEVVLDEIMLELYGFEIGDEIKLIKNDIFKTQDVKVVGFVQSSLFLNLERGQTRLGVGEIQGFIYGYELEQISDEIIYTAVRIKDSKLDDVEHHLRKIEDEVSQERFDRIIQPEREKLEKAQVELNDARVLANQEFEKAEIEFNQAEKELELAKLELEAGINQLSLIPITTGTLDERLEFAYASYEKSKELLETAIDGLNQRLNEAEDETVKAFIQSQLDEALGELTTLDDQFLGGYNQLKTGVAQYNQGVLELEEGRITFESEKANTLKALSDAQEEIDKGYKKIEKADHGSMITQTREDAIIGYREFYDDSNRIEKIGRVFPIIFFMVSILITLSTVTRMVEENRMEMGVYKALGYSSLRTSMKYVLFTLSTWLLGSALGLYLGFDFIPSIIYDAYRIMYQTPDMVGGLVVSYAFVPITLSFISSVGVAFVKSMRVSTETTAQLLRPVSPKIGQRILLERIGFVWKRLSFLYKVSFRNLFRNKTRFLMTLFGIGGTTGLLIVGFGISHSIYSITDLQFEELYNYDGLVFYNELEFDLEQFDDAMKIHAASEKMNGYEYSIYAAEELKELPNFIKLQDRKSKDALDYKADDVIFTEKFARLLDVKVGDSVQILIDDKPYTVMVDAITENYVYNYIYTSIDKLNEITDGSFSDNMLLFTKEDTSGLAEEILKYDDVLAIQFLEELSATYQSMMASFDIVIWVVVGAALALEVLVLTNLISMNMSERKKELATLKVLGFYPKELSSYILRENIILTLMSIAFGLVFGKVLHLFVITQAEIDLVMFNYELRLRSYLVASALTLVLSILINYMMARKADKVNMSEALKSFGE
ncbi:MAG TPA: FtsX-like permease family protein, partial [Erysipelothrix sp.]|nr:FtsX-like permease family protein [Erysipelothrix sp.]